MTGTSPYVTDVSDGNLFVTSVTWAARAATHGGGADVIWPSSRVSIGELIDLFGRCFSYSCTNLESCACTNCSTHWLR